MSHPVSLLVVRSTNGQPRGWKAASRHGDLIAHQPLRSTEVEAARAEAQAMFPDAPVWVPSLGEAYPS